jgi:hypothetical protein
MQFTSLHAVLNYFCAVSGSSLQIKPADRQSNPCNSHLRYLFIQAWVNVTFHLRRSLSNLLLYRSKTICPTNYISCGKWLSMIYTLPKMVVLNNGQALNSTATRNEDDDSKFWVSPNRINEHETRLWWMKNSVGVGGGGRPLTATPLPRKQETKQSGTRSSFWCT